MNSYGNPIVTYDEIVEALKAIIDCSKNNGYLDEYSFLNAKYDSVKSNPLQIEQEKALIKAIQSLEKTIDAANKVIREALEKEVAEISATNIFTIPTKYKQNEESRKLAAQDDLVIKLKEMSLPLEILSQNDEKEELIVEKIEESPSLFEEIEDEEAAEEELTELSKISLDKKDDDKIDIMSMDLPDLSNKTSKEKDIFDLTDDIEEKANIEKEKKVEEVKAETVKSDDESEETNEDKKIDTSKVQLIKKALVKAKEKENEQLVKILEQQLIKEIEALKS